MQKNNKNTPNFKVDDYSSSFVVDLKSKLESLEEKEIDHIAEYKEKAGEMIRECKRKPLRFLHSVKNSIRNKLQVIKAKIHFVLGLWRLFYNLCSRLGWTSVFAFRLVYLFTVKLSKPFFSFLKLYSSVEKKIEKVKEIKDEVRHDEKDHGPKMGIEKSILYFSLVLFALVLPFKLFAYYNQLNLSAVRGKVIGVSEAAIANLVNASKAASKMDFQDAAAGFSSAGNNFLKAQSELNDINDFLFVLASFFPDQDIRLAADAKKIVSAGKIASDLGNNLALAINSIAEGKGKSIGNVLEGFIDYGGRATLNARDLNNELKQIDSSNLPYEYQEAFLAMLQKGGVLEGSLAEVVSLAAGLKEFLGTTHDKRYLLVFQNNAEMRASGGFIGSFAIIDFRDGKIKNIEVPGGGSYDTEAGLKEKIIAPEPLHLVNPLWHFWDANWWPDWPTTAKKLMWFYEKSDGSTVDGVISFTPTVIEKMLRVIGPIDMTEKYGVIVDADNFWTVTQTFAEQKPDQTKEPKKIIGDLMAEIIAELPDRLDQGMVIELMKIAEESMDEKQVMFFFNDNGLQRKVIEYGWGGEMKSSASDYLMVTNTNIGGGKSDRKIEERIYHEAEIMEDGSIVDTVRIERSHTGIKREQFAGVRNVDWMRVYVPLGSELIEASGFGRPDAYFFDRPETDWTRDPSYKAEDKAQVHKESGSKIYAENNHTVFANWSMVDPGETITVTLKYRLPFKVGGDKDSGFFEGVKGFFGFDKKELHPYSLLWQKQPGAKADSIESRLSVGDGFGAIWTYPDKLKGGNGWNISDYLGGDKYWATLLEKK